MLVYSQVTRSLNLSREINQSTLSSFTETMHTTPVGPVEVKICLYVNTSQEQT